MPSLFRLRFISHFRRCYAIHLRCRYRRRLPLRDSYADYGAAAAMLSAMLLMLPRHCYAMLDTLSMPPCRHYDTPLMPPLMIRCHAASALF